MQDKLAILRSNLPEDLDAVLITSLVNRQYYLGFPSSAGTIVVTKQESCFIVDSRYAEAAQKVIQHCPVVLQESQPMAQILALLKKHGVKRLGIESMKVTVSGLAKYQEAFESIEIVSDDRLSKLIEKQRAIKNPEEIAYIAAAQKIADRAFTHILDFIRVGRTEQEIAIEMEQFCRREGSEKPSFTTIVAAGKNSSMPHAIPSDNKVQQGDFVTMDFGTTVNGYPSDMTRTVAMGSVSEKQQKAYDTVLRAQLESTAAIKAGAVCREVDKVARDIIEQAGCKGLFGHGLGHCLGLDVHEEPRLSPLSDGILEEGMVTSVEPGVYLPGEFGLRIEDIVVVTKEGSDNFCTSPKNLIVL